MIKWVLAAFIGVVFGMSLMGAGFGGLYDDYTEGKEKCKAELPRNKQCVMTFVEE